MLNSFGKATRRLRIERDERLLDMAQNVGVSSAFLSNIEHGRKPPPDGLDNKIIDAYALVGEGAEIIRRTFDQARERIAINTKEGIERETVAMFARSLSSLDDAQFKKIQELLSGGA